MKTIFFSADVVDSTRYKQTNANQTEGAGWIDAFETFFREMPLVLMGQIGLRHQEFKEVPELSIWKVLGDEIVFSARTSDDRDTAILVHALRQALLVGDRRFWKKCGYHVKGCAWTVDFTNQNLQIEIPEVSGSVDEHGDGYSDFIGPDVDVGFRLAKCAESRELILDLSLVETILEETPEEAKFFLKGHEILKGCFDDRAYPILVFAPDDRDTHDGSSRSGADFEVLSVEDCKSVCRRFREGLGVDETIARRRTLRSVQLFQSISDLQLHGVEAKCRWRRYQPGEHVFHAGSGSSEVFFVIEGELDVRGVGETGQEVQLASIVAGETVGEMAAVDKQVRSASLVARTDCMLALLSADDFIDTLSEYSEISFALLRKLASIVRVGDEKILEYSLAQVKNRVFGYLCRLAKPDSAAKDLLSIRPLPPLSEIGRQVGANREQVADALLQLYPDRIVERQKDRLYVLDYDALSALAARQG
jgi:CRP-like cAMP-binding protein